MTDLVRVSGGHRPPETRPAHGPLPALLAALIGIAIVATACGHPAPATTTVSARQRATQLAALHRLPPIYRLVYRPTAVDQRIAFADLRLTTACMARHGFRYQAKAPEVLPDTVWEGPAPFGLETLDSPAASAAEPSEEPPSQGKQYARALYGDPDRRMTAKGARVQTNGPLDGCMADTQRRLLGADRLRWMQVRILLYEAEQDARQRLDGDPAFRAVNARWHDCMREGGFPWADPMELFHALPPDADVHTSPATRADLSCKDRTDYLTVGYQRLAAMQQQRLDADPTVERDWKTLLHRQDVVARGVLPGG
jgi:hypothetical protein